MADPVAAFLEREQDLFGDLDGERKSLNYLYIFFNPTTNFKH